MKGQVESINLYNNGYAFLTDANGNLMFHPRIDIAELTEENKPAIPDGLLSESTFTHYTFNGVAKEAVWLKLTNGMRLYVSVPEEETDGDWKQLVRDVLIAAAIVLVAAIIVTRLVASRITKPLRQLTEAAALADQGNYDFALDYNGKDEIGALTNTFKRMGEHVKAHISDLNKRVFVDALTSVKNKGAFASFIEDLQKQMDAGSEELEYAIGVFDCDDLKTINDRYGHDKRDIYLKTASRLICKVFQHSPVFRIGGDEFAVILRNDDYRDRDALIETFRNRAQEISATTQNPWEQIHVAMGLAVYSRTEDHSVIDTVRRADKNMYTDKKQHKEQR
jgi:diguanylate cyclase (GGDEF)-like protein